MADKDDDHHQDYDDDARARDESQYSVVAFIVTKRKHLLRPPQLLLRRIKPHCWSSPLHPPPHLFHRRPPRSLLWLPPGSLSIILHSFRRGWGAGHKSIICPSLGTLAIHSRYVPSSHPYPYQHLFGKGRRSRRTQICINSNSTYGPPNVE